MRFARVHREGRDRSPAPCTCRPSRPCTGATGDAARGDRVPALRDRVLRRHRTLHRRRACPCSRPGPRASTSCCGDSSRRRTYSSHWIRHPGLRDAIDASSTKRPPRCPTTWPSSATTPPTSAADCTHGRRAGGCPRAGGGRLASAPAPTAPGRGRWRAPMRATGGHGGCGYGMLRGAMGGNASGGDDKPRWQGATLGDSMNDGVASGSSPGKFRLGRGDSVGRYVVLYRLGCGRHGGRLRRLRPRARPQGRAQAAARRRLRAPARRRRSAAARGPGDGQAVAPQRGSPCTTSAPTRTGCSWPWSSSTGSPSRSGLQQARRSWRRSLDVLRRGGRGAGRRPRRRARAPRLQARQRARRARRAGAGASTSGWPAAPGPRTSRPTSSRAGNPASSSGDTLGAQLTRTGAELGHAGVHGPRAAPRRGRPTPAPTSSRSASRCTRRCTGSGRSRARTPCHGDAGRHRPASGAAARAAGPELDSSGARPRALDRPDDRYPSMGALLEALDRILRVGGGVGCWPGSPPCWWRPGWGRT